MYFFRFYAIGFIFIGFVYMNRFQLVQNYN